MKQDLSLDSSIPANNVKIIEIYNKLKTNQIVINPDYQRKLVWKRQHKIDFIETILKNFPFPEVYLAPQSIDQKNLVLIDEVVDGQQRLSTIRQYVEEVDVFAEDVLPIAKFSELDETARPNFLNYEVSVRYLKNATPAQIKEIFQRINRTDYALNKIERLNAQWGASEFVCFCKQIVEPEFSTDGVQYIIPQKVRTRFLTFFHGIEEEDDSVFSEGDQSRMMALQYIMTLVATLALDEYFARNERVVDFVQRFHDAFPQGEEVQERLDQVIEFLKATELPRASRWFNKANLFSLIVELDRTDRGTIVPDILGAKLMELDYRATLSELGLAKADQKLTKDEARYIDLAREAVNQKAAREARGAFLQQVFDSSRI